jgi:hypothetical protein
MTIEDLISQLADLGQKIGHKSEVRAWNLTEQQSPMLPLAVRDVAGVSAGWDKHANKPIATLRLI